MYLLDLVYPETEELLEIEKGELATSVYGLPVYFRVRGADDADAFHDGAAHAIQVSIRYLDVGTDVIQLAYSTDGSTETTQTIVTKGNTGKWKWKHKTISSNARFDHSVYLNFDYADFALTCDSELLLSNVTLRETALNTEAVWKAAEERVTATAGEAAIDTTLFSGWTVSATYLARDTGTDNTSAGLAPDDYPFYAGATYANRASAPFRVTPAGALVATSATITGAITATSGAIGGFSIGADYLCDAANSFGLASTVTGGDDVRFWAGATFANRASAPFRATEAGAVTATNITITGGAIDGAVINNLSITAGKIGNLEITAAQIANSTITGAKIGSATITSGNIASGTITGGNIANLAITAGLIANLTITAAQIANLTITGGPSGKIATSTITRDNIVAATITATEIAAGTITASNIASGTITASNIASGTITATQIAAGTITADKISVGSLAAINANIGAATINDVLTVGSSGGIYQGSSGSFASPNTGWKVYNSSSNGVMEWWNSGYKVVEITKDAIILDYQSATAPTYQIRLKHSAAEATRYTNLFMDNTSEGIGIFHINVNGADYRFSSGGSPAFMVASGSSVALSGGGKLVVNSNQVVEARKTGWGAPTGTATRSAFATSTVTLSQLAERVKALIDDLRLHGLIGD